MKKISFFVVLSSVLTTFANRVQVWTQEDVSARIPDTPLTLNVSQENRIGVNDSPDGKKHLDEIHVAPTLWYGASSWLDLGLNDRLVLLRNGNDVRYKTDHRPGIDVRFKTDANGWDLSNRSRFIYRQVEHERGYFRYRNLSRIDTPWKLTNLEIRPYASYEWYFDEGCKERRYRTCNKFSIQWLTVGATWRLWRNFKADFHYMLTETRDRTTGNWSPGHVIGIGISASF